MTFANDERCRLVAARDGLFKDPGFGVFAGKPREFVVRDASLNLWEGIRHDVIHYFKRNKIAWWGGSRDSPTGHLLSSQVACVNHLYALRQRSELATAILRGIDQEVVEAALVDDGYVEFEFIGKRQYLPERRFSRGEHCTSVDAFMIGRIADGSHRAFLIEWKYIETYRTKNLYCAERAKVYDHLIEAADSPLVPIEPSSLYFEPFYQLMRQTLLAWLMVKHRDHECSSYRHIHVVPRENVDFHGSITAPKLTGASVSAAWRSVLRTPENYVLISPADFLQPIADKCDTLSLTEYLRQRYGTTAQAS